VLPSASRKYPIKTASGVGNGGFCYRRRGRCLEVVESVDPDDLNWDYSPTGLPDDVFFSYFGFGLGIFRSYDIALAHRWSKEPFMGFESYGFHSTKTRMDARLLENRPRVVNRGRKRILQSPTCAAR
jgi:hypothetical protein